MQARDAKKIYTIDPGLRRTRSCSPYEDAGKIAENLVYMELRRLGRTIDSGSSQGFYGNPGTRRGVIFKFLITNI